MNMHDTPLATELPDLPDLESRVGPADHHDLHLWLRLLSCSNLIQNEIRSRLRTEFQTTLPRFDLLAQLQRAKGGMKMSELSRHMMVTNGNVTGITDQLEKDGLVERIKLPSDRRSSLIRLTDKGRRQYKKMAIAHESWIQALFTSVPQASREQLFDGLGELKIMARLFTSAAAH